jgi:hypothetical protein
MLTRPTSNNYLQTREDVKVHCAGRLEEKAKQIFLPLNQISIQMKTWVH